MECQVFLAPLPSSFPGERLKAPTGRWKDGFLDCCSTGILHPSFWCSLCCTQIAMAQVISRMQLNWLGEPGTAYSTRKSFNVIVILVVCYIFYSSSLELAAMPFDEKERPLLLPALKFLGIFLFSLYSVYALCRTRETVRARFQIPEQYCMGCEDLCCSIFCGICTVSQMLRHTGEYETYPGTCCTKTGHPDDAPLVV